MCEEKEKRFEKGEEGVKKEVKGFEKGMRKV